MNKIDLNGRCAVVTGGAQGFGRAIAERFVASGAKVAIWDHDLPLAEKTAKEIGTAVTAFKVDVSDLAAVEMTRDATIDGLGGIDILVNNAGIFPRVNFLDMTEGQWDEVLNVNLKGTFFCTQTVVRQLVQRGQPGAVINLASSAAFRSSPRGVHYVSSKAGIVGFTRATALELARYRIRVNAIAPGTTDTAQPRYGMSEEELQAVGRQVPLGRMAVPDDIANMAVFLASEAASHITGQTMHVNGGAYLY
jgi:NAD(P)-dependent dehydrogenase (short-subunit alcohol dehydrogenase family)